MSFLPGLQGTSPQHPRASSTSTATRVVAAIAGLLLVPLDTAVGGNASPSAAPTPSAAPAPSAASPAAAAKPSYAGRCTGVDARTGVTVVVDFRALDGNDGIRARKVVRCSPARFAANGDVRARTGYVALRGAGITPRGTQTFPGFVCRLNGRPNATETLPVRGNPNYREQCVRTPPDRAFWGYWYTSGRGQSWQYSTQGAASHNVVPGGLEGWAFSLNAAPGPNPKPRFAPRNPVFKPPTVALRSKPVSRVTLGRSVALTWSATRARTIRASGAWIGARQVPRGTRKVTPKRIGLRRYVVTARGPGGKATDSVRVRVVRRAAPSPGATPDPRPDPHTADPSNALSVDPLASSSAAWLSGELVRGAMPSPFPTPESPTDWGLTLDSLLALYAAGTGQQAARQIVVQADRHAGDVMGISLYGNARARLGGQTAKLLVVAAVAGRDPHAFGRVMRADGTITNTPYDLRRETLRLVQQSGPSRGRISDRGSGFDSTNLFSQAFAVIGLSRTGGVDRPVVSYLLRQQCSKGYFRMFDYDGRTCDRDDGSPDSDGTALALQALMAARDSGVTGLDGPIAQGVAWLLSQQERDGSFGGGSFTGGSNSNSTGLVAQTLAEADKRPAFLRAQRYIRSLTVTGPTYQGTRLAPEIGAIAYDAPSLAAARTEGIVGRDQWVRATAQAIYALAPASLYDLGAARPVDNPQPPDAPGPPHPPAPSPTPPPEPSTEPVPPKPLTAPSPERPSGSDPPNDAQEPHGRPGGSKEATTPEARLAGYLAAQFRHGDHIEVTDGNETFVDYDLTADAVLSLRLMDQQNEVADHGAQFLLDRRSIAAFAHGAPYDRGNAVYAEALAKLVLVASTTGGPRAETLVGRLSKKLAALESAGIFTDAGEYGDASTTSVRQAWVTMALVAAGRDPAATRAGGVLVGAQCTDGSFPKVLAPKETGTACTAGQPASTGVVVQALNAVGRPESRTSSPDARGAKYNSRARTAEPWSPARTAGLTRALQALNPEAPTRTTAVAAVAGGRQALGLDISDITARLHDLLGADGGLPSRDGVEASDLRASIAAGPVVAGVSWLTASSSPLTSAVTAPLAPVSRQQAEPNPSQDDAAGSAAEAPATQPDGLDPAWLVAGGLGGILLLWWVFLLGRRSARADVGAP